jgi:hypothetical protein
VARWFCEPQDVEPVIGRMGAMVWQNYVLTQDADKVVRDFDYRIEAGSARKPNKTTKIAQLNEMGQVIAPVIMQFATSGMVEPYNAYVTELAKAHDIDPSPFLVQLPEQEGPSPEEQEAQAQIELKVAELEIKMQEMQAKLDMEQESLDQELEHEHELHKLTMSQKREEMTLKKQESKARAQATKTAAKNGKAKVGAK